MTYTLKPPTDMAVMLLQRILEFNLGRVKLRRTLGAEFQDVNTVDSLNFPGTSGPNLESDPKRSQYRY